MFPNEKKSKKNYSKVLNFRKNSNFIKNLLKFAISSFLVTVVEISNKHLCKLDKILRNFSSWQNFVFVTVYEVFGFEFCYFML